MLGCHTRFLFFLLLLFAACRVGVKGRAGQNLLLITLDTVRADRLGCYGYKKAETPHIDRLARRGVLFEQAIAQVPLTLPSHASILTGLYPPVHGVRDNTYFRLDPEALTLAEILKQRGYQTAAFVGAYVLDSSFGLAQGFDLYDDRLGPREDSPPGSFVERRAEDVVKAFRDWLERAPARPFFVWIHLFDPHLPYTPPSPFHERFSSSPYDGEIAYVDQQVGALLKALEARDLLEETLVGLTSDHGESLGEHGERSHGFFLYDSTLRVPLILSSPRSLPAGMRLAAQVRTVDVLPTVLELLELTVPSEVQGESLVPFMSRGKGDDLPAYSECYVSQLTFGWAPLVSLRQGGFKYIEAPRAELYDLGRDPAETRNLLVEEPERSGRMKKELVSLLAGWPGSLSSRHQPDPEAIERMRSLGYAGAGLAERTGEDLPDPKDRIRIWQENEQVILHLAAKQFAEAASLSESILREDPTNLLALEHLAYSRLQLGAADQAIALYQRILSLDANRPLIHLYLGNLFWRQGQPERAEKEFRAAVTVDPRFARAYERIGYLHLSEGRPRRAVAAFARSLEIDQDRREARLGLARSYRSLEKLAEARDEYARLVEPGPPEPEVLTEYADLLLRLGDTAAAERALRAGPNDFKVHYALAVLLSSSGKMSEALAELEAALSARPDFAPAHHDQGIILSRSGRIDQAIHSFERALSLREDPLTRNALGAALSRKERFAEAIPHFERALALAPRYRDALENLAEAYQQVGRLSEAREARRRAARLQ